MKELGKVIVLLSMVFCHIADDFYLQGNLAQLKQKEWWKKNYPDLMYRKDYLVALLIHAFSWSFMIHIPLVVNMFVCEAYPSVYLFMFEFWMNIAIHIITDNKKANVHTINLTQDQLIHLIQIVATFLLYEFIL